jgi:membrane protein required for colicin V production
MLIDIIFVCFMAIAFFKGIKKGLILAVFSLAGLVIGLAAAMKLSVIVADYLKDTVNISARWLPFLSFILVFIAVILLVRLGAAALEKTIDFAMMGWLNKLGGIIFYAALYIILLSVLIFYAEKLHVINPTTISASKTYTYLQPWGPKVMDMMGAVIPWFKDMFTQLEKFFEGVAIRSKK